ncbi:hypothetical protein SUDANB145_03253 [Streptomyces sp. enrichment culture]|uniref:hypothetical protein n=1 Tax=Streptomyces sp. enrichment culture TaxID=1795815 RepID=UPI003F5496A0
MPENRPGTGLVRNRKDLSLHETDDAYATVLRRYATDRLPGKGVPDHVDGIAEPFYVWSLFHTLKYEGLAHKPSAALWEALADHGMEPYQDDDTRYRIPRGPNARPRHPASVYAEALNRRNVGDLPGPHAAPDRVPEVKNPVFLGIFLDSARRDGRRNRPDPVLERAVWRHNLHFEQNPGTGKWMLRDGGPEPSDAASVLLSHNRNQGALAGGNVTFLPPEDMSAGVWRERDPLQRAAIDVYAEYRRALPDLPEQPPPGLSIALDPQVVAPGSGREVIVTAIEHPGPWSPEERLWEGLKLLVDPGLVVTDGVSDALVREGFHEVEVGVATAAQETYWDKGFAALAADPAVPPLPHDMPGLAAAPSDPGVTQGQPAPHAQPRNLFVHYVHATTQDPTTRNLPTQDPTTAWNRPSNSAGPSHPSNPVTYQSGSSQQGGLRR